MGEQREQDSRPGTTQELPRHTQHPGRRYTGQRVTHKNYAGEIEANQVLPVCRGGGQFASMQQETKTSHAFLGRGWGSKVFLVVRSKCGWLRGRDGWTGRNGLRVGKLWLGSLAQRFLLWSWWEAGYLQSRPGLGKRCEGCAGMWVAMCYGLP